MNSEALTAMLTTLQQTQNEFCQQLLREVRSSTPSQADSTAAAVAAAATFASINGNFAQCTARYSGSKEEHLESFIDSVESYKCCLHISEENAVRGLSLLLTRDAGVWWQGVKTQVKTWEEALERLRSAFGERRPPFVIYTELFSMVQGEETTELFVSRARALLSKLPEGDLCERVQLDMVFGLLNRRIRKRIKRESVDSFSGLLKQCQSVEDSRRENYVPISVVARERDGPRSSTSSRNRAVRGHVADDASTRKL
ncbi:activity-regulated cytoskeleton associated protein 2-like [Choristoneura fumiferana]|uniref:activity-regulated cytoskeleton associated protein 2-like n=1 Tax=Choristoneura fumiferana TaxID=7141 RepID=UPI003D155C82